MSKKTTVVYEETLKSQLSNIFADQLFVQTLLMNYQRQMDAKISDGADARINKNLPKLLTNELDRRLPPLALKALQSEMPKYANDSQTVKDILTYVFNELNTKTQDRLYAILGDPQYLELMNAHIAVMNQKFEVALADFNQKGAQQLANQRRLFHTDLDDQKRKVDAEMKELKTSLSELTILKQDIEQIKKCHASEMSFMYKCLAVLGVFGIAGAFFISKK